MSGAAARTGNVDEKECKNIRKAKYRRSLECNVPNHTSKDSWILYIVEIINTVEIEGDTYK